MAQWLSEHPGEKLDWFDIERDYVPSGEGADT